jgi:hypothetical protein
MDFLDDAMKILRMNISSRVCDDVNHIDAIETAFKKYFDAGNTIHTVHKSTCMCGSCDDYTLSKLIGNMEVIPVRVLNMFVKNGWLSRSDPVFVNDMFHITITTHNEFASKCALILEFFDPSVIVSYRRSMDDQTTILDYLLCCSCTVNEYYMSLIFDMLEKNHFDFSYSVKTIGYPNYLELAISHNSLYMIRRLYRMHIPFESYIDAHECIRIFKFVFSPSTSEALEYGHTYGSRERIIWKFIDTCQTIRFCIDLGMEFGKDKTGKTLRVYVEEYRVRGTELVGDDYDMLTKGF